MPKVAKKVNADFILNKLIPFILREAGRGFAMEQWQNDGAPGTLVLADGIIREYPSCGTVACIGGSAGILMSEMGETHSVSNFLGLTADQYENLCYGWMNEYHWPAELVDAFAQAHTPLGKAKVAVRLLKKVVATDGKVLGSI